MTSRPSPNVPIATVQAVATFLLGTPIAIEGGRKQNNPDTLYCIDGTGTLTQNMAINPDPDVVYARGDQFQILWNCNITIPTPTGDDEPFSISIAGRNVSEVLTGTVNTFIWLNYDGAAWQISNTLLDTIAFAKLAEDASSDASDALSAANSAVTTANSANTKSNTAITTANSAASSASAAAGSASSASSAASSASSSASAAAATTAAFSQQVSPTAWTGPTIDMSGYGSKVLNYIEPASIDGDVELNFSVPTNLASEIIISLPFGGTHTVSSGTNSDFPDITGVGSHISVLTLVWSRKIGKYIVKAFSQN